jgi:hypothetical protein
MPNLGKWWIIAIGVLVAAALFLAMQFTNREMRESGQTSTEHLKQESGDDPHEHRLTGSLERNRPDQVVSILTRQATSDRTPIGLLLHRIAR